MADVTPAQRHAAIVASLEPTFRQKVLSWFHWTRQVLPGVWGVRFTSGLRSTEEQRDLWRKGRELRNGSWEIVDRSKVVTHCDGIERRSNHQERRPGEGGSAVDFVLIEAGEARWHPGRGMESEDPTVAAIYEIVGTGATRRGLVWGGQWPSFADYYHLEARK